jgi:hypothetical protein
MSRIIDIRHPSWRCNADQWEKWRLTYKGGDDFLDKYVDKYSNLEKSKDLKERKKITPSPSFAKAVVNEVKNSIFQRMADITRRGGPDSYKKAVEGQGFGVDLHGTSMNTFMGREVLPELLTLAKVGIFVDMPPVTGPTYADSKTKVPYLYVYKAEEILSWSYRRDRVEEFEAVLLVDYIDDCDPDSGLPQGTWKRHRLCWIEDGVVWCEMYDEDGIQIDLDGEPTSEAFKIDLPYIPFITLDLTDSLLSDIANHQIALANLESSDVAYLLKSNFPFYVEQQDDRDYSQYLQGPAGEGGDGTANTTAAGSDREITVGNTQGRRYRTGMNEPSFINPSSEPVQASMEKQKNLKDDIRQLVNLALSNIKPKMASAESKAIDEHGLEAGLSYIGLELERGERRIAQIWADYEKSKDVATVKYPQKYSLQTDEDRRKEVEQLEELRDTLPSKKFQKEISKQIATKMLSDKISVDELDAIYKEIDEAESITADPDIIWIAIDKGVLDLKRAAKLLGFPEAAVEAAAKDHAERLARISKSQSKPGAPAARGVPDLSGNPTQEGKEEKERSRDTTKEASTAPKVRGEAK